MDGIVYSASLALGFAAVENALYVLGSGLEAGYVRALLPVPGHAFFGVVMGYFLAKARFHPGRKRHESLTRALFVPASMHGAFNYLMSSNIALASLVVPLMAALLWTVSKRIDILVDSSPFSPSRQKPENRATQG
jgi:RsiW-degrading membrane proteinase PrsW (M82 family)